VNRSALTSITLAAAAAGAGLLIALQAPAGAQTIAPARADLVAPQVSAVTAVQQSPRAPARRTIIVTAAPSETSIAPCPRGRSRRAEPVRLPGPAGIELTGQITCGRDGDFRVEITGGAGEVGGVSLVARDFSGSLTSENGRAAGTVVVALPGTPRVVPEWRQRAWLRMTLKRSVWTGTVAIRQERGGEWLAMAGPLASNGSYRLEAEGSIGFAGTRIGLAGDYRSAGYPLDLGSLNRVARSSQATWSIVGARKAGVIDGVRVRSPRIEMTQAEPGVTGAAALLMPRAVTVQSNLTYVDEGTWTLTGTGSPTEVWQPSQVPGLTVQSAVMRGAVTSRAGRVQWGQSADMSVVDEQLTLRGTFTFTSPSGWRLRMDSAEGSILGAPAPVTFTGVSGDVLVESGALSGAVTVKAGGALLAGLPVGWTPSTSMSIAYASSRSQGPQVTRAVAYTMANKSSRIVLSGDSVSSKAFKLTATGSVFIGSTPVPFGGTFESVGYVTDGVTRIEPYYAISGSIAEAPGGSVPLGNGAGLSGGSFGFSGGQRIPSTSAAVVVPRMATRPESAPHRLWLRGSRACGPLRIRAPQGCGRSTAGGRPPQQRAREESRVEGSARGRTCRGLRQTSGSSVRRRSGYLARRAATARRASLNRCSISSGDSSSSSYMAPSASYWAALRFSRYSRTSLSSNLRWELWRSKGIAPASTRDTSVGRLIPSRSAACCVVKRIV